MLKIRNLKAGYDEIEILHGINLVVKSNEIVAVFGSNGAGKSTLLKSIFNLCAIYSGNITFMDKDITRRPTHTLVYDEIGYVPQGKQIFSDLTVYENLEVGSFGIVDKNLVAERMNQVFDEFPFLRKKQFEYGYTLSEGQQQMLAIGIALMRKPKLLLLDEPSLGLAPIMVKAVFRKIKKINESGVAVLLIEQNISQAIKIAKRYYILESGQVVFKNKKNNFDLDKIMRLYFGK